MVIDRGLGNSIYHGQVWSFQEVAFHLRLENEKKQTRGKEHSRQREQHVKGGNELGVFEGGRKTSDGVTSQGGAIGPGAGSGLPCSGEHQIVFLSKEGSLRRAKRMDLIDIDIKRSI